MPIYGEAYIGVLPSADGKIIGLSKYDRIVEHFGSRLQIQEELVQQIRDFMAADGAAGPGGADQRRAHVQHPARRARQPAGRMVTSAFFGSLADDRRASRNSCRNASRWARRSSSVPGAGRRDVMERRPIGLGAPLPHPGKIVSGPEWQERSAAALAGRRSLHWGIATALGGFLVLAAQDATVKLLTASLTLPLILAVRSAAILGLSLALGGRRLLRSVFLSPLRLAAAAPGAGQPGGLVGLFHRGPEPAAGPIRLLPVPRPADRGAGLRLDAGRIQRAAAPAAGGARHQRGAGQRRLAGLRLAAGAAAGAACGGALGLSGDADPAAGPHRGAAGAADRNPICCS